MWLRFASINDTLVKIFNRVHQRHPVEVGKSGAGGSAEIFGAVGCLQSNKVIDARSKRMAGKQEEKLQY